MASALTPLGQRTREGFIKKFGAKEGPTKFQQAMDRGLIDRSKMENVGLNDESATPDDEDTGEAPDGPDGMPIMNATPNNPAGGGAPQPSPRAMPKRRPPTGAAVGRAARGSFQKRPG